VFVAKNVILSFTPETTRTVLKLRAGRNFLSHLKLEANESLGHKSNVWIQRYFNNTDLPPCDGHTGPIFFFNDARVIGSGLVDVDAAIKEHIWQEFPTKLWRGLFAINKESCQCFSP
jgi:hypothetical protein